MGKWFLTFILGAFLFTLAPFKSYANEKASHIPLRVAVSANFSPVLSLLIPEFTRTHNIEVEIISGASGALFQQIMHGAPYDIFLSADHIHPQKLNEHSLTVKSSLQTYALGQLAFWSAEQTLKPHQNIKSILSEYINNADRIAIANPNTAPYGNRAFETLQSLGLWQHFKNRAITGINVSQTYQQLRSGAVKGGFVAQSQLKVNNLQGLTIPEALYTPIKQQLVILKRSKKINAAQKLVDFLQDKNTQKIIERYGYKVLTPTVLRSDVLSSTH